MNIFVFWRFRGTSVTSQLYNIRVSLHQFQKDRSRRLFGIRQNRENWKRTPVYIFVFWGSRGTSVISQLKIIDFIFLPPILPVTVCLEYTNQSRNIFRNIVIVRSHRKW